MKSALKKTDTARWGILAAATISMMLIGLYQYSWTLFVGPIGSELKATSVAVQLTFTIFTTVSTFAQPIAGIRADRRGPLLLNILGGIISGIGWIASSYTTNIETLYLTYGIGSLGVGIIYATAVGTASRWFPDRRGLATGLTAFGFGSGAAIMNPVISWIIGTQGFRTAFLSTGTIMLLALTILGFISRYPNPGWTPNSMKEGTKRTRNLNSFKPLDMVRTTSWWLIYAAFILTSQTGLLITSQVVSLGDSFKLARDTILLATILFPISNSLGRIVGGYVSDRLGRQVAMVSFFAIQGLLSLFLLFFGSNGTAFFAVVALIGFFWGPIFTFFPSLVGDYYGQDHSTSNTAITYTAKAWGGWIGGYMTAYISSLYGFTPSILLSILFSFIAAMLVSPYVLRKPASLRSENPL